MRKPNIVILILLIFSICTLPVLAQRTGSLSGSGSTSSRNVNPTLTVQCNIRNAQVSIFDAYSKNRATATGTAPFSIQLDKGFYTVIVNAPGYDEQQQSINLTESTTLNFDLGESKVSLQIQSNARNAEVIITGSGISGHLVGSAPFTAQISKGRYNISVSAPGYISQSRDINLNTSQALNFNLDSQTYNLTITSNVDGAKVFIRGGDINGQITGTTDLTTVLPPGQYQVKVNAPHYYAEEQTIQFNGTMTLNVPLRARTAKLDIIIPNNMLDYTQQNPAARIKIFDNGSPVNGTSLELTPGQHTIRITSGGVASQQTINVQPGESYRIELNFGFALIKE